MRCISVCLKEEMSIMFFKHSSKLLHAHYAMQFHLMAELQVFLQLKARSSNTIWGELHQSNGVKPGLGSNRRRLMACLGKEAQESLTFDLDLS